jgi:hypothetical protein
MDEPVTKTDAAVVWPTRTVLAGSCAYAIADASSWRAASLSNKPHQASRFYLVIAAAMVVGLALDFAGLNAVKMLFWSAVAP